VSSVPPRPRRSSWTRAVQVGDQDATLTASPGPDGRPAEIALRTGKHGSTLAGMTDAFSTAMTLALRRGAPLDTLTGPLTGMRFAPSGRTDDPDIPHVTSIADYVARRLTADFGSPGDG
jgi:hypothetical protein